MEKDMAKVDVAFRETFETKLIEMFPDVPSRGTVSRQELMQVMTELGTEKFPLWMMKEKVGRGLYAVNGTTPAPKSNVVMKEEVMESYTVDYTNMDSLVPKKDPNYVAFGNHTDLENIIKSGIFYPSYITGPTGNGKSTMVEQICAKHKKPLIRVNLNMMTDEEQLIGSKTLENGNVEIVEGPVLIAMRTGTTLLLDEIDAGSANTLLCLQPILEGKPYYFKLKNEMIVPAAGFNLIATANTKGKGSDDGRYIGTNVLNEAFLERFAVTFEQEYPNAKVEVKIVKNLMTSYGCEDEEFAETLVKWADSIRRTFEDGGVDETITTRRMTHIVRAFAIFKKREKAVELCCNRFDSATKDAFLKLYDMVANPQPEVAPVAPEVKAPEADEIPF
jgi:MoxR-like ATPase